MRPGLVKPGSRRRQHPAAPLAEVAHRGGPLWPGLVKSGSRRRQEMGPLRLGLVKSGSPGPGAATLAEVAPLAGVLQAYLDTLRQDSYTRPCLVEDCVTVSRDTPEEAKYSASFVFPTCCPHRSKFQAVEKPSENEAKTAVFVQAIGALQAAEPERFELPKPEENVHSIPLESVVPGSKLAMYRVEVKVGSLGVGEVRRFGLLSALPPSSYAFQLEVWDEGDPAPCAEARWVHTVRIEPTEPPGTLDMEQYETVQAFHMEAVADGADDATPGSLLAVCLGEDGRIDWNAMRDRHPTPRWLRCLRVRVLRLQCLECLASHAPVGPAPT